MAWNPRYLSYCHSQGEVDPNRMLEKDEKTWPGGVMTGFILWIQNQMRQWEKTIKWPHSTQNFIMDHPQGNEAGHREFDDFLRKNFPQPQEAPA